ncbi:tight adherence protein B [Natronincola peptidivorans]|uniref:Tight adherence protein B n=1 Tax=Natronincola peptidivorans TaxID=426128 RepID=A0A1I0FMU3_9FIRM|nr:type II secretion system F family protein [Natronincola peptidivorans]SET59696.1 tight adherence protein B [Natronincola peptidivorans]
MEGFIAGFSFITVVLMVLGIHAIMTGEKKRVLNRMAFYTDSNLQLEEEELQKTRRSLHLKELLGLFGKAFATKSYTKKIEKELLKAEIPMKGEEFIVLYFFIFAFAITAGMVFWKSIGPTVVLGVLSLILPNVFIKRKKAKRFEKLNHQIGEGLTVMSNGLRAGYSFQQTIDLVSKEMSGPLAVEFGKTTREINLGTPIDQALMNLTDRVESDDLELLVTAVLIQRQIGGNLAEILDNISSTIRERIRIKGEIKTLTAQGRISGLIIGLLPPVMFVILMLMNPSYMNVMLEREIGWMILAGGVVSQGLGIFFIQKVINIEV